MRRIGFLSATVTLALALSAAIAQQPYPDRYLYMYDADITITADTNALINAIDRATAVADPPYTAAIVNISRVYRLGPSVGNFASDPTYRANLRRFLEFCESRNVEVIPELDVSGSGGALLASDVNLVEGIEVSEATFHVDPSGESAALIPDTLPNTDDSEYDADYGIEYPGAPNEYVSFNTQGTMEHWYESGSGPRPMYWSLGLPEPVVEQAVGHSGNHSLKLSPSTTADAKGTHWCRMSTRIRVTPRRHYKISMWIKTDCDADEDEKPNPAGYIPTFAVYIAPSRDENENTYTNDLSVDYSYQQLPYKTDYSGGAEWREITACFNSRDLSQVTLGIQLPARDGQDTDYTAYIDDVQIEEVGLVNIIRRDGCPVTVTNEAGDTTYTEGTDYDTIEDEELGYALGWAGSYEPYHTPPNITLLSARIKAQENLKVSWYHPLVIKGRVYPCMSDGDLVDVFGNRLQEFVDLWRELNGVLPARYMLSFSEIHAGASCAGCKNWLASNYEDDPENDGDMLATAGHLAAESLHNFITELRNVIPGAEVMVASDMLNPHLNGHDLYDLMGYAYEDEQQVVGGVTYTIKSHSFAQSWVRLGEDDPILFNWPHGWTLNEDADGNDWQGSVGFFANDYDKTDDIVDYTFPGSGLRQFLAVYTYRELTPIFEDPEEPQCVAPQWQHDVLPDILQAMDAYPNVNGILYASFGSGGTVFYEDIDESFNGRMVDMAADVGEHRATCFVYVDANVSTSGDGTTWATAKKTIQEGINAADDGNIVLVADGTYDDSGSYADPVRDRNLDFHAGLGTGETRAITVRSLNGPAYCTIDLNGSGHAFIFHTGEDETSVVDGFRITGAWGSPIHCYGNAAPRIVHCRIENNGATNGAAVWCAGSAAPQFIDCEFLNNWVTGSGGAVYATETYSHPVFINCLIANNHAAVRGGAVYRYDQGGLTMINCTIVGNTAGYDTGGVFIYSNSGLHSGIIARNCIVWGNDSDQITLYASHADVQYSCVEGGYPGSNNTSSDPLFIDDAGGDFHLSTNSPCINAGSNAALPPGTRRDLAGADRVNDADLYPTVDMGAYEVSLVYVDAAATGTADGTSWTNAFTTIQNGLDGASAGDTVIVADGTYDGTGNTNLDFDGKAITLRSLNGPNSCIIDCEDSSRAFMFTSGETLATAVEGFTIMNGDSGAYGGGAMYFSSSSSARIVNCRFQDNVAGSSGGAVFVYTSSAPEFIGCELSGNTATNYGGAASVLGANATFVNCLFAGNEAGTSAGAVYSTSNATVSLINCTIVGNDGGTGTGGVAIHANTTTENKVANCIVWDNTSSQISGPAQYTTVQYSFIEGGYEGTGNDGGDAGDDPLFVDADGADDNPATLDDNDYRIDTASDCIDAGNNSDVPAGVYTDVLGKARITDGNIDGTAVVDLGAYEISVVYVDDSATGVANGTSWTNAFTTIQAGINAVYERGIVLVADGTYTGFGNIDMDTGGKTVMIRSLNGPEECTINCQAAGRAFCLSTAADGPTVIDGFTITSGNSGDYGGAAMHFPSGTLARVVNCRFEENTAGSSGGAIYMSESCDLEVIGCEFVANTASGSGGAAIAWNATATFVNCLFAGNTAGNTAGAVYSFNNSIASLINCTIVDNDGGTGAGGFAVHTDTTTDNTVANCIVWNNTGTGAQISGPAQYTLVDYSFIEGGWGSGTGNDGGDYGDDPLFVDPDGADNDPDTFDDNDYRIDTGSDCIDAGYNYDVLEDIETDLAGNARIVNDDVDMGAYETQME